MDPLTLDSADMDGSRDARSMRGQNVDGQELWGESKTQSGGGNWEGQSEVQTQPGNAIRAFDEENRDGALTFGGGGQAGEEIDVFTSTFIVPPRMKDGDVLTPFQFDMFGGDKTFYFFGRYNEGKDACEFALAGAAGTSYKLSLSDGNSPYGWKVKRHGTTKTSPIPAGGKAAGGTQSGFFGFFGGGADDEDQSIGERKGEDSEQVEADGDEERSCILKEAFEGEDLIVVPHAMMRSSSRQGILDAKYECVKPWSFYGPSLPEYFCRCKLKVIVYNGAKDFPEHEPFNVPEQDLFDVPFFA